MCDKGIKDGIYSLIEPVIDNVFFVLDTINTKFTIGVYIEKYCSMTALDQFESGIITLDDKLGKEQLLTKDLLLQASLFCYVKKSTLITKADCSWVLA